MRNNAFISALALAFGVSAAAAPAFSQDLTPPVVAVTAPVHNSYLSSLPEITGTAFDDVAVSSVQVRVQRQSDGYYWDGSAFSAAEAWLDVPVISGPLVSWTYSTVPAWLNGAAYEVNARAMDSSDNWSVDYSTSVFHYDTGVPVSRVVSPVTGSTVSSFTAISGTALDNESFVGQVWVKIDRAADDYHWNGALSQWTAAEAWNLAAGTFTWTYDGLPEAGLAAGTTYTAVSRAADIAGNVEISTLNANSFVYAPAVPAASVLYVVEVNQSLPNDFAKPTFVTQNDVDRPVIRLTLRAEGGAAVWKGLKLDRWVTAAENSAIGSWNKVSDVAAIKVWYDANGDGLLQSSGPAADILVVSTAAAAWTFPYDAVSSALGAADASLIVPDLEVFFPPDSPFVPGSGRLIVNDGQTDPDLKEVVYYSSVNFSENSFTGLVRGAEGTLARDWPAGTVVSGQAILPVLSTATQASGQPIGAQLQDYFISYDISGAAGPHADANLGLAIRSTGYFLVEEPASVSTDNIGVAFPGETISLIGRIREYADAVSVRTSTATVAPLSVLGVNQPVLNFTTEVDALDAIWRWMLVYATGSVLQDGTAVTDVSAVRLWRDMDDNGALGAADVVIGSGTFGNTIYGPLVAKVGLAVAETIITTSAAAAAGVPNRYIVTYDLASSAALYDGLGNPRSIGAYLRADSFPQNSPHVEDPDYNAISLPNYYSQFSDTAAVALANISASTVSPTVGITAPVNGSAAEVLTAIWGTAADDLSVSSVALSIKRAIDGLYWDGTSWAAPQAWLSCSLWPSSWTYSQLPGWVYASTYTAVASAVDSSGNPSLYYSTSTFLFLPALPGGLASAVAGAALGVSSISWTWTSGTLSAADHFVAREGGVVVTTQPFGATGSYIQETLTPNASHTLSVTGANAFGESAAAASAIIYTLAAQPASLAAPYIAPSSAALTWALNGNAAGTIAQLWRSPDDASYTNIYEGATLSHVDAGLEECTVYYYKARNVNGAGLYTAFTAPLSFTTAASTPAAPGGLYAAALDGARIALSWEHSPSVDSVTQYRLYYDNASGTINYGAPYAVFSSTVSSWTTPALAAGSTYKFAVRALTRCGVEEVNASAAYAQAVGVLSGVRAAIKVPQNGKRIKGNSVTVIAELTLGLASQVKNVRFQYRLAGNIAWTDIDAANINHPNPDTSAPYFVHWDADAMAAGTYELRALATDIFDAADPAPPIVTVAIDPVYYDTSESVLGGQVQKEQKIANTVASTVQAGDDATALLSKVVIPAGAVSVATVSVTLIPNPPARPAPPAGSGDLAIAVKINLSNGQSQLAGGNSAVITLSYKDDDGDGVVDGTTAEVGRLRIYAASDAGSAWTPLASTVDRALKTVSAPTTHFSFFSAFATPASGLSSLKAYPNPWQPGAGGRFDAAAVTFTGLPNEARIKIFTILGELVRQIDVTAADAGTRTWDGRNSNGSKAASGVYLVRVESGGGDRTIKLAVER